MIYKEELLCVKLWNILLTICQMTEDFYTKTGVAFNTDWTELMAVEYICEQFALSKCRSPNAVQVDSEEYQ